MTATESCSNLVLVELAKGKELTKRDLLETIGAPRRTVYSAVRRLVGQGLVRIRPSLIDTRQSWHGLTDLGWAAAEAL